MANTKNNNSESTKPAKSAKTAGQLLRETRIAKKIDLGDAANQLKLSEVRMEQLETDQYQNTCLDIFDCGHLRNYCKILDMQPEPVFELLAAQGFTRNNSTCITFNSRPAKYQPTQAKMSRKWLYSALTALITLVAVNIYNHGAQNTHPGIYDNNQYAITTTTAPQTKTHATATKSVPVGPQEFTLLNSNPQKTSNQLNNNQANHG